MPNCCEKIFAISPKRFDASELTTFLMIHRQTTISLRRFVRQKPISYIRCGEVRFRLLRIIKRRLSLHVRSNENIHKFDILCQNCY